MQDFEEKIKPFVVKIVDEDNPQIVEYKTLPRVKSRSSIINLMDPKQIKKIPTELPENCSKEKGNYGKARKIKTPDGIFENTKVAAEFYGVSLATITYRCTHWTGHEYYYYVGE